jgi:adenylylsulfate kinase
MLIMMVGLPGTGKSALSRALVERSGGFVLDKDIIRPALFGPTQIEYSVEQDDFCQHIMMQTAEYLLKRQPRLRVFLDGRPFSREYQRELVRACAEGVGTRLAVIECVASEATAIGRIERGLASGSHLAANRTVELYFAKKNDFEREPVSEPKLVISTDNSLEKCISEAQEFLKSVET